MRFIKRYSWFQWKYAGHYWISVPAFPLSDSRITFKILISNGNFQENSLFINQSGVAGVLDALCYHI